jgi:hypothetical protein
MYSEFSFDLDENRIAPSGNKELYVCVYGPDGKPITMPTAGSGTFTTRDEGDKVFTNKVDVNYEQGKRLPVSFDWNLRLVNTRQAIIKWKYIRTDIRSEKVQKHLRRAACLDNLIIIVLELIYFNSN